LFLSAAAFLPFAPAPFAELNWWEPLLWVFFIAAANLLRIPMLPKLNVDVSLGGPVMLASAVLLAPPLAAAVNLIGFTNERELKRTTSIWHAVFNRSQAAVTIGLASFLAHGLAAVPLPDTLASVLQLVGAAGLYNVLNILVVAVALVTLGKLDPREAAKGAADPFPRFATDFVLVTLLALFVVVAYEQFGALSVLLLALPLGLGYSALASARESEDRAEELAIRVRELETLNKLGTKLVQARRPEHVRTTTERALSEALDTDGVTMSLHGDIDEAFTAVEVPAEGSAVIGVPQDLDARASAVVEAVAGLAGMALQRLDLERELAENEKARARLSERILEEGNQERSRIALYIHDDVLPYLAAAEIQADNVRTALYGEDTVRADQLAVAVHNAVHDGIARLRQVLDELRDQVLTPGGLAGELRSALDDIDLRSGVRGHLDFPDPMPPVPLAVEILVLETVRGCLANVGKHADAENVHIAIEVTDSAIRVTVEDDGKGFDPSAVGVGHHGLVLMTQRVELARGRIRLDSAPGDGTRVHLEVPL
jgi:signal transduction histidine kinase